MLLAVQESSAASHKCHFRVRYFDRVLTFPYKSVLMVDLALKAIRCAGSDPPGPSANAASSNGTRNLNMQFHATVVRHRVARGACFERAMFDSRKRKGVHETHKTTPVDYEPPPSPALYHGKGGCDAASSSMKEAVEAGAHLS